MTLTMEAMRARMPKEQERPSPPREVVERAVAKAEQSTGMLARLDEDDRLALTTAAHFAFGALAGAAYGSAVNGKRSITTGIEYGLAVWALAYNIGLPALELHPSAKDDTDDRNHVLLTSHVVWGAVLGLLAGRGARRRRG